MSTRSRRRQRRVINRRWSIGLLLSLLAVVVAVAGMLLVRSGSLAGAWIYGFFAVGVLGAVSGMLQTIVRNKAGDDIDEATL